MLLACADSLIPQHNTAANPNKINGAVNDRDKNGNDGIGIADTHVGKVGTPIPSKRRTM